MALRVVQWTTGNVGRRSVVAILANPELELKPGMTANVISYRGRSAAREASDHGAGKAAGELVVS